MLHKIKRLFTKKKEGLKHVISFDGHDFYTIDAIPMFTVNRFFHYIKKSEEINTLGVPLEYFLTVCDQLDAICDKPDKSKVVIPQLTGLLRFAVGREENRWFYMTVALIEAFILVDDEPLNEMSVKHNEIKRKIFSDNPDARFFFISFAAQFLKQLESSYNPTNYEAQMRTIINDPMFIKSIMTQTAKTKAGSTLQNSGSNGEPKAVTLQSE